jgi:hypothetical protein
MFLNRFVFQSINRTMKTLNFGRTVLFALSLIALLSSCSPDKEAPVQPGQAPSAAMSLHDLGPLCAEPQRFDLVDDQGIEVSYMGHAFGELVMQYNPDSTFFTVTLGPGWFIEKAAWHIGPGFTAPLTQNGILNTSLFPESYDPAGYVNTYTFGSAFNDSNANCHDLIFWCEIITVDFFLGPIQSTRQNLWAGIMPIANGFMTEICYEPCSVNN